MSYQIHSEIDIAAPADQVWRVLMDFDAYMDWNPFIKSIQGHAAIDEMLEVRIHPKNQSVMTFKPHVIECQSNRVFAWKGKVLMRGLFDGEHRFELIETDGGLSTRFKHYEIFSGLLVPLFRKSLQRNIAPAFDAMNQALKQRVENA